ncbi:noggin-2-like [Sinocyclocheilus anshuiensis]|nr:PREDICTED: noggin-2-like [Sinocyclocheilus anshuiensis]
MGSITRALPLLLLLLCAHGAAAQHYLRLRPSPSEHLPVPDLREDPDPEHDPREQDLSEKTLRKKLGSHFDSNFMSIHLPTQLNASAPPDLPRLPMPADLKKLNLTETPYGRRVKVGKKARRKFHMYIFK